MRHTTRGRGESQIDCVNKDKCVATPVEVQERSFGLEHGAQIEPSESVGRAVTTCKTLCD